jgi:hypothetical protein
MFMIGVHEHDIILAGKSNRQMLKVKEALAQRFEVKRIWVNRITS